MNLDEAHSVCIADLKRRVEALERAMAERIAEVEPARCTCAHRPWEPHGTDCPVYEPLPTWECDGCGSTYHGRWGDGTREHLNCKESPHGTYRDISVPPAPSPGQAGAEKCAECIGSGRVPFGDMDETGCPRCDGTGKAPAAHDPAVDVAAIEAQLAAGYTLPAHTGRALCARVRELEPLAAIGRLAIASHQSNVAADPDDELAEHEERLSDAIRKYLAAPSRPGKEGAENA